MLLVLEKYIPIYTLMYILTYDYHHTSETSTESRDCYDNFIERKDPYDKSCRKKKTFYISKLNEEYVVVMMLRFENDANFSWVGVVVESVVPVAS